MPGPVPPLPPICDLCGGCPKVLGDVPADLGDPRCAELKGLGGFALEPVASHKPLQTAPRLPFPLPPERRWGLGVPEAQPQALSVSSSHWRLWHFLMSERTVEGVPTFLLTLFRDHFWNNPGTTPSQDLGKTTASDVHVQSFFSSGETPAPRGLPLRAPCLSYILLAAP